MRHRCPRCGFEYVDNMGDTLADAIAAWLREEVGRAMSRQKTKVRTYWRAESTAGSRTLSPHESAASAWRALGGAKSVKVYRVDVYRLAPLIELPAWEPAKGVDREWQTELSSVALDEAPGHVGAAYWGRDDTMWTAWTEVSGNEVRTVHSTADEARTACETRLMELGFRVARAKAGAK